mmetsp:Transcript_8156/g.34074  ORF Transcript_8156/g.34074 Transcript_8156/m.34074 type:complete len:338 (-) Transcript_8156:353-1366(-)
MSKQRRLETILRAARTRDTETKCDETNNWSLVLRPVPRLDLLAPLGVGDGVFVVLGAPRLSPRLRLRRLGGGFERPRVDAPPQIELGFVVEVPHELKHVLRSHGAVAVHVERPNHRLRLLLRGQRLGERRERRGNLRRLELAVAVRVHRLEARRVEQLAPASAREMLHDENLERDAVAAADGGRLGVLQRLRHAPLVAAARLLGERGGDLAADVAERGDVVRAVEQARPRHDPVRPRVVQRCAANGEKLEIERIRIAVVVVVVGGLGGGASRRASPPSRHGDALVPLQVPAPAPALARLADLLRLGKRHRARQLGARHLERDDVVLEGNLRHEVAVR